MRFQCSVKVHGENIDQLKILVKEKTEQVQVSEDGNLTNTITVTTTTILNELRESVKKPVQQTYFQQY